jgi:hypothetical protein
MPPERAVPIVRQVAAALQAAHDAGVVHGDVKPANVLLDDPATGIVERAYLADFGLARMIESATPDARSNAGTLLYMAPEQLRGEPIDPRADIYSLGCVLYQCLSGTPPFRGSDHDVMLGHLDQAPPPLGHLAQGLSAAVGRALAKDPSDRFASAAAFSAALDLAPRASAEEVNLDGARPGRLRRLRQTPVRLAFVVAVGSCIAAAALAVLAYSLDLSSHSSSPAPFDAHIVATQVIGDRRSLLAIGKQGVFVAQATGPASGKVERIDPTSLHPSDSKPWAIGRPLGFSTGSRALWVVSKIGETENGLEISRITSNGLSQSSRLSGRGTPRCVRYLDVNCDPVIVDGNAWLGLGKSLVKIGGPAPKTENSTPVDRAIADLAYGAGWLWAGARSSLLRIDPASGSVVSIDIPSDLVAGGLIGHVVASGSDVWVSYVYADAQRDELVHIDAHNPNVVTKVLKLPEIGALASINGSLWVAQRSDGSEVTRLDLYTGDVTGPSVKVPDTVTSIRGDGHTLWLMTFRSVDETRRLVRVRLS